MTDWFPQGHHNGKGWRLDIVSLLAVIGESSMEEHSQAITASWIGALPRIMPAPQTLLKPTRPTRLPSINASVFGVHTGCHFEQLNYFPNLIHPINDLPAFAFQVWRITRNTNNKRLRNFCSANKRLDCMTPTCKTPTSHVLESRFADDNPTRDPPPHVPARRWSPLNILNFLAFCLTIGLFVWAVLIQDGSACLALFTVSMVASVVGLASHWTPTLMRRNSCTKDLPAGDVVIRARNGAILVVKCDENVARELYNGTEECEYFVGTTVYRMLVGLGTFLLMVSVVLLGNCKWEMQAAIGIAYIVLNGLFWAAALITKDLVWDLSLYHVEKVTPVDACEAENTQRPDDPEGRASFTRTMWYAIRETGDVGWVYGTGAAPKTEKWDTWLATAKNNITAGHRAWRAVQAKDDMFVGAGVEVLGKSAHEQMVLSRPGKEEAPVSIIPPQETG